MMWMLVALMGAPFPVHAAEVNHNMPVNAVTAVETAKQSAEQAKKATEEAKQIATEVNAVAAQINAVRATYGLKPLVYDSQLANDALVRATECATFFSHTRPNGKDWWTVDDKKMYGEALAEAYPYNMVVDAWMNSPSHKELIVGKDYETFGIAEYRDATGSPFFSLEFGYLD